MKTNSKLIIFDMDGTLIDSGNVITNTINFVRSNFGIEKLSKETMLLALNDPAINGAEFFYGTDKFTDKQRELFGQYYDKHCISDIVLYDGIEVLLQTLKSNYQLSVATNASSIYANKMLDFLGIKDYFSIIVGADMVEHPKPKGDMLKFSCEKLQILKENSIMVCDSKKDLNAAKDFGIRCVLVNWGFSEHQENEGTNIVHDVVGLINEIDKINMRDKI